MIFDSLSREDRCNKTIMSKCFLDKHFQKFHVAYFLKLHMVQNIRIFDLFPQCGLMLWINRKIIKAHDHEMRCSICSGYKECSKLRDQLLYSIPILII